MIIPKSKKKELEELMVKRAKEFVVGNPLDENVDIGPLINEKSFNKVRNRNKRGSDNACRGSA